MTNEIINKTGIVPISRRTERWAGNQTHFDLLIRYGYKVDCSATPHINWEFATGQSAGAKGSDDSLFLEVVEEVPASDGSGSILKVPVSIKKADRLLVPRDANLKYAVKTAIQTRKGAAIWLHPNGHNLTQMKHPADRVRDSDENYIMFMLHSSEQMPGGSPTFRNDMAVKQLDSDLTKLFSYLPKDFEGITLKRLRQRFFAAV